MNICLGSTWKITSLSARRDTAERMADWSPMIVATMASINGSCRE